MLTTVDAQRFTHLTSGNLKLVREIYLEISCKRWFDQRNKEALGAYVINMYQRGMVDPNKLRTLCLIAAQKKYRLADPS